MTLSKILFKLLAFICHMNIESIVTFIFKSKIYYSVNFSLVLNILNENDWMIMVKKEGIRMNQYWWMTLRKFEGIIVDE